MRLQVIDNDASLLKDFDSEVVVLSRRDLMNKQNLAYILSEGIDELNIELSVAYKDEFVIDLFRVSKEITGTYSGSSSELAKLFKGAFPDKSSFITKALLKGTNLMEVRRWRE